MGDSTGHHRIPAHPLADPARDGSFFVLDLIEAPELPAGSARATRLSSGDTSALEEAMQASGEYPAGVAATRLSPARDAYGVRVDGMIVTYGWVAHTPEPIGGSGLSFRLRRGDVYIYDCATRPAYQGRGYYKSLLRGMAAELRGRGCRRAWIGTEPGNAASQRGILGAGFTKVADVNLLAKGGGMPRPEVYGVPGVPEALVENLAWALVATSALRGNG